MAINVTKLSTIAADHNCCFFYTYLNGSESNIIMLRDTLRILAFKKCMLVKKIGGLIMKIENLKHVGPCGFAVLQEQRPLF